MDRSSSQAGRNEIVCIQSVRLRDARTTSPGLSCRPVPVSSLRFPVQYLLMINATITNFAGLNCRVIDALEADAAPSKVVVMCHGFGAPGDDLASFGPHLINSSESIARNCRFVFPEAPIDLGPMGMPGGRAWWPINMAQLAEINQTRDYTRLSTVVPDGMRDASTQLANAIDEMMSSYSGDAPALVLGGFSQGAMISTDVVLHHGAAPRQLVLFSGTLLCRGEWESGAAVHAGCYVLQSHGRQDMVLPFEPAEWLRDLLKESGFEVNFVPFNGSHEIPMPVLQQFIDAIE